MQQQQQKKYNSSSNTPINTPPIEETLRGFEWFTYMRANSPVVYDQQLNIWHVFRYDDVYQVITDHHTFSSADVPNFSQNNFLKDTIVAQDPPDHRRLRQLTNQAFTRRAIISMTESIRQLTQELLDQLIPLGTMDIVSDLAFPLTCNLIAAMLEIPIQDRRLVYRWVKGVDSNTPLLSREDVIKSHNRMGQELYDYIAHILEKRRREPCEGFISALSTAMSNNAGLSDDELLKFCVLLLVAGQETVQNLITNAIYCFTKYPQSRDHLLQQPEHMPEAIEEILRYLPPFWVTVRRTTVDAVVGGKSIPANMIINAWNASANHDGQYFADPEHFDIRRDAKRHLSFGHGIHFCLGAPLARMEANIILPMLCKQLKNFRRIPDRSPDITAGPLHQILSLPIMFEA
ncbi:putative cytochrome P450 YjiB [Dictyobacter alpinus]|uniref:Putative cytochrome P450 YjiB n=1 Tax=Dictyobacter alpinus TaxID=2014873 RepID=A0A402BK95_9CHLR|nr:cytochrome P450 [Dictyobacter alpinus]GCE31764.1 putative cytochrome P450 YjiB [Dictyobacter alpinus]